MCVFAVHGSEVVLGAQLLQARSVVNPLLAEAARGAQVPGHQDCAEDAPTNRDVVASPEATGLSGDQEDGGASALGAGVGVAHAGEFPTSVTVVGGGITVES